ncbi:MAG: protease [Deltaproteobacteria bacterium]|nr:MAG: protease [Deltaproteobacteria bacterium]
MELSGKNFIILAEQMVNDQEFWYPYYRLQEAGAKVTVVGSGSADHYTGKAGTAIEVDAAADQISLDDYDGVVIPGGYAPDHLRRYPAVLQLVRRLFEKDRLVAAICHAGWVLVSAGILQDRHVTSYIAVKDDLVNAGANWADSEVVIDGNLVTSRTPADLPAFMRAIISVAK